MIKKILVKDIDMRLGSGAEGYKFLKMHPYFKSINWEKEVMTPLELALTLSKKKSMSAASMPALS